MSDQEIEPGALGITIQVLYRLSYEDDTWLSLSLSRMLASLELQHKMENSSLVHDSLAKHKTQINPVWVNTYVLLIHF